MGRPSKVQLAYEAEVRKRQLEKENAGIKAAKRQNAENKSTSFVGSRISMAVEMMNSNR